MSMVVVFSRPRIFPELVFDARVPTSDFYWLFVTYLNAVVGMLTQL